MDDDDVWVRVTQHWAENRPEADRVPIGTVGRLVLRPHGYQKADTSRGRMWLVFFPETRKTDWYFECELEAAEAP